MSWRMQATGYQERLHVASMQVMPAVGGCVRTAQRCAALDAAAPWPGFPAHAARLAAASSQRVFSDKVRLGLEEMLGTFWRSGPQYSLRPSSSASSPTRCALGFVLQALWSTALSVAPPSTSSPSRCALHLFRTAGRLPAVMLQGMSGAEIFVVAYLQLLK